MALFVVATAMAADAREGEVDRQDDADVHSECEKVLTSPTANTLSEFVAIGRGAEISNGDLEDFVKGLRCSDEQIIAYAERNGLPYHGTIERSDVFESGRGRYNRIHDFCIPNRGFSTRLLRGECGGVTRFMMVDDQITYIISHGFK